MMRIISLICFVCVGAPSAWAQDPTPAPSGPKPTLLMLPTTSVQGRTTTIVPDRVNETSRKRLQEDGRVVLLPLYTELRKQSASRSGSAAILEAERLYTSGIGLVNAGQDQRAVEVLQRSVDLLKQHVIDIENYNILSDALANLSLAYWRGGFDLDGRKYIKEYAYLKPAGKLNTEKYPAELLAILDEEQKKISKGGPGKVAVTSNVEGATIFVNGVEKGAAPIMIEDVGFGVHYFTARSPDGKVWASEVRVKGRGQQQVVSAELVAPTKAAAEKPKTDELPIYYTDVMEAVKAGSLQSERLSPYLGELAREVGAGFVGWIMVYKEGSSYIAAPFVWRGSDGRIVRVAPVKYNAELSNLAFATNELSASLIRSIEQMPEADVVTSEQVGPKAVEEPKLVVKTPTDPQDKPADGLVTAKEPDKSLKPPPDPGPVRDEDSNLGLYLGIGAGAVVVTGLVILGVYLLSGESAPIGPSGFDAEVSW